MNKNAIKKFAIAARTRLIATVSDKAGSLGITKEKINEPSSKGNGFEVYKTPAGTEAMLQGTQIEQRRRLVSEINARGFDVVMEEVAYTWFNRICAIRFMEVNDYLPTRVRVLSSLKEGKNEPDLLTEAPNVELGFSEKEREWIINAKSENRLDELFSMLFIKQCNKLSEILPELFEATEDYTEMLLILSYTNKDDVIRMLVDGVDEKDFDVTTPDENGNPTGQVEIIGWLYQYYNTELKDDTFAQLKKNVKISKERIPAATQLFTPDWIVRYMVENSVGRIWMEHLRAVNPDTDEKTTAESFGWKYYLPEAEQEPEVDAKLAEIRKSYADIKPEDILCIDPCMGSGHIIVAMFDVLMDIYRSVGYGERDAAFEIVEHNLHGLDIDKRAYQLAYFAVMMKGRQYNRRFFRGKEEGQRPQPKVYSFVESNDVNRGQLKYLGEGLSEIEKNNALNQINGLLDTFKDAREYGSILNVANYDWELLRRFVTNAKEQFQMTLDTVDLDQTQTTISNIIDIGEVLAGKYDAVVTNPPYMGNGGMGAKLSEFVKKEYTESKTDLFAVFINVCGRITRRDSFYSLVTQHAWMFLASFEKMRAALIHNDVVNMAHLGTRAFEEIAGEVVQTTTFTIRKSDIKCYKGAFHRLVDEQTQDTKEAAFLKKKHEYYISKNSFEMMPGCPFAYWVSNQTIENFENMKTVADYAEGRIGLITGDSSRFIRYWSEVDISKIGFGITDNDESIRSGKKWFPMQNGGGYRKWYGNLTAVVNWQNDGYEMKFDNFMGKRVKSHNYNGEFAFKRGITWTTISTSKFSCRYADNGYIYDTAGPFFIVNEDEKLYIVMGYLQSKVAESYLAILNPTINFPPGYLGALPFDYEKFNDSEICEIKTNVEKCVNCEKDEWDSYEMSWDFKKHPLLCGVSKIRDAYDLWKKKCDERITTIKSAEETLNKVFIHVYGLEDEMIPDVDMSDITARGADEKTDIKSLISYAVGCMFGRYSLDKGGIISAGGIINQNMYRTFIPDKDNIIPITDEEYFEDDIVGLFCAWVKKAFDPDFLEDNLDYIASVLGNKGDSSREAIRNYFINEFFKDHCGVYSVANGGKRPIYWLFDSGKHNGFKALIYLHRYDQDTVGRVRTDYLHKTQKAIEQAMQGAQYTLENSKSGTEKSKATKRISKYTKQLAEIQLYDEAIAHIANKRIPLDLDDGVKVNYAKFQGVEVSREGMKTVKVDLLARI